MAHISRFALAVLAATSFAVPAGSVSVAHANYSCEPGQPNCTPMGQGDHATPWPQIACRAWGDPEALPDDLKFTNVGDVLIKAGSLVFWQMLKTGDSAWFSVPYDLPPGGSVNAADLLSQGVPENTRCLSRLA